MQTQKLEPKSYMTQKMAHFYLPGLLFLIVLMVISECRGTEIVSASQEEDVALPCFNTNVTDLKSCYRVKWIKRATHTSQAKVILARPKMRKIQDAERVKWEADGKGQMSLFLSKVQKSDEGLYSCEIYQGWDCTFVKNISLKVKECKTSEAVKETLNTSVTMNCPVDMTSGQRGPQNVSWVILKGGIPVPFNSKRAEINGTSLVIRSMISSDSGWYRCMYMLGQTHRCFDINLQLKEVKNVVATTVEALTASEIILETRKEESNGALIAVVASVIIAVVIVAVLIGLFIYRRWNKRNAQQTQRHRAEIHMESNDGYEIVALTCSEGSSNQAVNSLYHQYQGAGLCTFH